MPTKAKTRIVTIPVSQLIEDLSVYPRSSPSSTHVANLAFALESGAEFTDAIIADAATRRLVDGFHRTRAYRKVFGDDHPVTVELRRYATELDLLKDAIALNCADRALPMTEVDKTRMVIRLGEAGVDDGEIATILHVPAPRVTEVKVRIAHVQSTDGPISIALKRPVLHMQGSTISEAQAQAIRSAPGTSYGLTIRQLRMALQFNLLNASDGRTVTSLRELAVELAAWLEGVETEPQ